MKLEGFKARSGNLPQAAKTAETRQSASAIEAVMHLEGFKTMSDIDESSSAMPKTSSNEEAKMNDEKNSPTTEEDRNAADRDQIVMERIFLGTWGLPRAPSRVNKFFFVNTIKVIQNQRLLESASALEAVMNLEGFKTMSDLGDE